MNPDAAKLRNEVFGCEHCVGLNAFTRSPDNGRFYKFPPLIGSTGKADILFIGINPRRSKSNLKLHEWLMASPEAFASLASNRLMGGEPYITLNGEEEHYHSHMLVVEGVFGKNTEFEAKAAVTELMLCASTNEPAVLSRIESPCANLYLRRVLAIVKPQVVIAVGSGVRRHLQKHFAEDVRLPIVPMEHPRQLNGKSRAEKTRTLQPVIEMVRETLVQNGWET